MWRLPFWLVAHTVATTSSARGLSSVLGLAPLWASVGSLLVAVPGRVGGLRSDSGCSLPASWSSLAFILAGSDLDYLVNLKSEQPTGIVLWWLPGHTAVGGRLRRRGGGSGGLGGGDLLPLRSSGGGWLRRLFGKGGGGWRPLGSSAEGAL